MAKVYEKGQEQEGKSIVTEAQAIAYDLWSAKSPEAKQARAKQLLAERAQRTPGQQLAELDLRLGVGQGATKERQRLASLMQGAK